MFRSSAASDREIACQQVLMEDSSVFSIQWMTLPRDIAGGVTPERLLHRYLACIRRFTLALIRPRVTAGKVEFRLAGTAASLISFTGPVRSCDGGDESLSLAICGGLLVQPDQCERGELSFIVGSGDEGIRLTLRLSDYCPILLGSTSPSRVRKWLYRLTQAYLHKVVTVRFLGRFYAELTGGKECVRVVRVRVQEGEEI